MNIVITSQVSLNDFDTRANHVMGLFEGLSELSQVYLFVPKVKQIRLKSPFVKYIPYINLPIIRIASYEIILFIYLLMHPHFRKLDAIYNRHSPFTIFPLIYSKLYGIPFFVEVNGSVFKEGKINKKAKLLTLAKLAENVNYRYATKIITVSSGIKTDIMRIYNLPSNKIHVIGNGTDIKLFRPMNKNSVDLDYEDNIYYVGFVGLFAVWQGLEYLVRSVPLIVNKYSNIKFILVGNGPLKKDILKMVDELKLNNKFVFVDIVPHKEIVNYINLFDICVILKQKNIPSSPLKLYEYMACGKPIIATDSHDFSVIEEFNLGLLVDPEIPEAIASAIAFLIENEDIRLKMGANSREYAVSNCSWQGVAEKVLNVISNHEMKAE